MLSQRANALQLPQKSDSLPCCRHDRQRVQGSGQVALRALDSVSFSEFLQHLQASVVIQRCQNIQTQASAGRANVVEQHILTLVSKKRFFVHVGQDYGVSLKTLELAAGGKADLLFSGRIRAVSMYAANMLSVSFLQDRITMFSIPSPSRASRVSSFAPHLQRMIQVFGLAKIVPGIFMKVVKRLWAGCGIPV